MGRKIINYKNTKYGWIYDSLLNGETVELSHEQLANIFGNGKLIYFTNLSTRAYQAMNFNRGRPCDVLIRTKDIFIGSRKIRYLVFNKA